MIVTTDDPRDLEFRLFGTFDVRLKEHALPPLRSRKEKWLLALLVLRPSSVSAVPPLLQSRWTSSQGPHQG